MTSWARHGAVLAAIGLAVIGCSEDEVDTEACGSLTEAFDFESGEQGFIHTATDTGFDDPWELGTPYYQDCHSGENCWVTNLWDDYGNCEAGGVYSPTFDLSACSGSSQTIEDTFRAEDFRFAFLFGTDRGETDEGWYLDDVELLIE